MEDRELEIAEVYLNPGEMFLARQPTIIRTLLGSCVGVAFWSRRLGVGALCHAMLPRCPQGVSQGLRPELGYRYVDFAIHDIGRQFEALGARRSEIEVKVFGGGDVLLNGPDLSNRDTVGSMNCDTALEVLRAEGFHIIASSLRGLTGVNIHFNTGNGGVLLRRLQNSSEVAPPRKGKEGLKI